MWHAQRNIIPHDSYRDYHNICMECSNATDMHVGCFSTGWTGGSWMAAHCDWIWN